MRLALVVFALLLAAGTGHAQTVSRIDIVDYGIYTVDREAQGRSSEGIGRSTVRNVRHAVTTTTVPVQIGVTFGFHYKLVGGDAGETVELRKVTKYPPPGLRTPKGEVLRETERALRNKIGETRFTSYALVDAFELVPGPWTIELWQGSVRLASQTFTLVKQP
jgi:hypothetical protein